MPSNRQITEAIDRAWHKQSAQSSLERWQDICKKEGWGEVPDDLPLLIRIFGASWYFTRYIFFRGREAALLVDNAMQQQFGMDSIITRFSPVHDSDDPETQLEILRLLKNEIMLQILACYLAEVLDQEQTEEALTRLAEASLATAMQIFRMGSGPGSRLSVLGMGRMSGYEMTFGSDLDLIIIFTSNSNEQTYELSRKTRALMRNIAIAGPAGSLYDMDMRLRPHGTSGTLLTSAESFLEYHQLECDIWERQVMTRCRPVIDRDGLGSEYLAKIQDSIYARYEEEYLCEEIINMRKRVQDEKGDIKGKFEVKRGNGGIMDIDFLTHYLQLMHGHDIPELRACSTRTVLKILAQNSLIRKDESEELLHAYDYLKRIEACARLFDMKSVSAFPRQTDEHLPVAAAMGYAENNADQFVHEYTKITDYVRGRFKKYLGWK